MSYKTRKELAAEVKISRMTLYKILKSLNVRQRKLISPSDVERVKNYICES
jgi:hypothetical protein